MATSKDPTVAVRLAKNRQIALKAGRKLARCDPGEEVVISGIAGVFPDSDNLRHFGENLLAKNDLISDDDRRWKLEHPEIPQRTGKLNEVKKFDAAFFGVHYKQAQTMDPMSRILLEKAYEAVVDAGYNPKHIKGSKTGVFIGACFSESEKTWFYEKIQIDGFGITGCSRAMLANRISYWMGINGPSYTVDSACSSSLYALEHAYKAIRDGVCDAALVGGCNLCLHPYVSLQFARLGVLSPDGRCKSFDEAANGYCRSEAVVVVLLQKKKNSRRIYCRLVHAKTNCDGYKEQGITYPSGQMQQQLLEEFYEECEVDPNDLSFIEAHGTGTKVGDPEEVKALETVFCPRRKEPLKIGSVKSNIGHSEPASGLCSVAKVILGFELGQIPPNINLKTLRSDIEAFHNGKIIVVTEPTRWEGGLAGVNSFGFGGANCHVLLSSNPKLKINNGFPGDDLPRLIVTSGRTNEAVDVILSDCENRSIDVEFVRLLQAIHSDDIPGHIYRGYTLVKKDRSEAIREIEYFPGENRPVWFVFSGMGSQWTTMGKSLMKLPIFADSINKCHQILKPKGVDLRRILTSDDPKILNNILNSFVGIAAIQIALVDILYLLGIVPDGFVGHSMGELGCAYVDGCLTAEQMMLATYYRGLALLETKFIPGIMVSIGVGYKTARCIVPPKIDVTCHNCHDSCIISGPTDDVKEFVETLKVKNIFTEEIQVSNIAYHSQYISQARPKLLEYIKKVITEPKLRSRKWISSSVIEAEWNTEKAKYSSAEYYADNLLNFVYFEEACVHIPGNAIVIEVSPHGCLQTILNHSLRNDVVNIPLMKSNHENNLDFFFCALGKIFDAGLNPQLEKLYPFVEFPVSKSTPMIAPLIRWEHSEDWYITSYQMQEKIKSGERTVVITLKDDELEYLSGHVVDGRNLYPATGYLMLAWETVALMRGELYSEVPVVFENVRFNRATNIPKEGNIDFIVMVQKGSGNFEVVEGGAAIVTGQIYVPKDINKECVNMPPPIEVNNDDLEKLPLNARDVYKELRLRGYNYKGLFRGITYANNEGTCGRIQWVNNFVAFMDTMLQMQILHEDTRGLFVPTSIQKLVINTKKHFNVLSTLDPKKPEFHVYVYKDIDVISCGGIEVRNLRASAIARKKPLGEPVLEKFQFVPHISIGSHKIAEIVRICTHIALETLPLIKVKTIELIDSFTNNEGPLISQILVNVLGDLPLIQADIVVLTNNDHPLITEELTGLTVEDKKLPNDQSALMVIATQVIARKDILQNCLNSLKEGGFILTRELSEEKLPFLEMELDVCFDYTIDKERILLVRKSMNPGIEPVLIKISGDSFLWLPEVQKALTTINTEKNQKLILFTEKEKFSGILGFFNCIRKETNGDYVRCYFIMDDTAPAFSIKHPLYKTQLLKDLALNVYKRGIWGSYRHLPLENISMVQTAHAYVNTLVRGDLTTLRWIEGPLNPYEPLKQIDEDDRRVLIHIYYAPLNFRDIMLATGKLASEVIIKNRIDQECVQGFEFAGKSSDGKRWMGMEPCKTMATMVMSGGGLLWPVPDQWTLEEASTIPVVYGTVLYALVLCGNIRKGEKVLIHAGTGGVGQAAINVCLHYCCEIFTTVGTPEKREFIRTHFPSISDTHIGNSRDTSFEQLVMRETNGKGVDLVLNSLAEEKLQASVRCLGHGGRFLEIGKFDLAKNNMLSMEHFLKEISFHGVMLDNLFYASYKWQKELNDLLSDHISKGAVKPLIRTVFSADEVEAAFRYMAAGKHMGKVLLKTRDEEEDIFALPKILLREAIPRYICQEDKSFIICGGLGGFGLELADWLVLRGARKLVLTSRKGVTSGYQAMRIRIWRSYGTNVVVSTEDITKEAGVKNLLNEANALGPVTGIFNLAVVLQDALFENQTKESFSSSAGPKALATFHLDKLSRTMCPELEQFVVFSSVSCGRGNQGQTNYGYSNSVMERICEARQMENLPALAIEWGAIGEVGLVADMAEENLEVVIGGTLQQQITSCMEVMDYFLKQQHPVVASMVVAEKRSGGSGSGTIVDTVSNILGLKDLKTVSLHSTLAELGMDSMMGVEIKQTLEREFEVFLTPQDIRSLTFAKLYEIAAASENSEGGEKNKPMKKPEDGNLIATEMGMHYFMQLVGDEVQASKPIIRIASLYENGSTVEVPTQDHPTVFVLPGIEGIATVMESLGGALNVQVLCLQYTYKNVLPSIKELAKTLINHIISRLPKEQEFNLIGYSFGGLVAMEVVHLLEADGWKGRLWIIDSSPEFLRELVRLSFLNHPEDIENQVQVKIITRFLDLIWPQASKELTDDLMKLKDWNARLDYILSLTPPDIPHSKTYQRALMNAGYYRVLAVIGEEWKEESYLKAETTLIRPTEISLQTMDDYGLSKYFISPVKVHFVDGNHFTILENKKTADLIMANILQ